MVKKLSSPLSPAGRHRSMDALIRFMGIACDTQYSETKGNKGRGAAQRRLKLLGAILVGLVCILGVIHLCFPGHAHRVIRHAKKLRVPIAAAKSGGSPASNRYRSTFSHRQVLDFIVSGRLNLVDLEINHRDLDQSEEDTYEGVFGVFCKLNFAAHKNNPSGVPMFRDLVGKSPLCDSDYDSEAEDDVLEEGEEDVPRGRVRVNLKQLAEMSRKADEREMFPETHNLKLAGVAFHESRCGSTLVANSLIAMNPVKHRVYSESAPPLAALSLCSRALEGDDEGPCTVEQGAMLLRDVMYFMGRSQDPKEERFFFKIQSAGTRMLEIFQRAMPETPWIFVYRDPVQVMMSHFAHGKRSANCLRSLHNPPHILQRIAERKGYNAGGRPANDDDEGEGAQPQGGRKLSAEEFCAAHLATLTETAVEQIANSNGLGMAVNYVSLPKIMYEQVLPKWGVTPSQQEIDNILEVSGHYSKGRGKQAGEWHEDSEAKEEMATTEIQDASKIFLQESYDLLEEVAKRQSSEI
ncbi:HSPB (Heat shock 27kDa) associated protein 1 [Seminavis robusta]|uniref:HSPB (Heat shock 27kDa) associated protein 1 n=1 Tax=Seminavis robusta TaxID=568900 RepID=A0A9N8H3W3_9STRA|nr:HSPB (Heat shock 27kDa) associated protein 1 [Seminavis robusta]|eukprot:Sro1_g000710.1 HSPB (Heat shock 27kDa) associated protein 1 (522) ;mRNA; f:201117-202948